MEFKNFSYLLLLIGPLIIPIVFGFKKQIGFLSNLKYLIPAILFTGAIFIIWDLRFEERAIWRFNSDFVIGKNILTLPFEEWLYFLTIPFLGVFIYELLKQRFYDFERPNSFLVLSLILFVLFGILAFSTRQKLYPFFTFFLLSIYLGYTIFRNPFKKHYTKFYLTYLIMLLPFIFIGGIISALPIIEYNPEHIIGIRLLSIPVENFISLFLLLLMNITIYEFLKERRIY
ncbi:MAG: lycopene cyclase domain-containing protein [Prolixibacteraceae bacterium]|jgi:lycopene cyclase domain-containing protein|nr:lycopene cyclase domain-containing protein [Prolixibacteraceae bacterium]MBT6006577.1 lycopene cyclase domain-containing protein [Prolixibacteraceae bacterium]MBT6763497.1 lycopene cyclase domain-containing protein [Prolixibacteraceae bacterium]MBT7000776.1 lycopene cyclase domain-containing protein [Prolixibacteraceae bacterium]MBT7395521.1 lycopene cyclase domain-containing protein [Prolixibacteraceae bacterium]